MRRVTCQTCDLTCVGGRGEGLTGTGQVCVSALYKMVARRWAKGERVQGRIQCKFTLYKWPSRFGLLPTLLLSRSLAVFISALLPPLPLNSNDVYPHWIKVTVPLPPSLPLLPSILAHISSSSSRGGVRICSPNLEVCPPHYSPY